MKKVKERKKIRSKVEISGRASTHLSAMSQKPFPVCWSGGVPARETSSTFQEQAQLRADEGQFSLFKNKARSDTTDL